MYREAKPVLGPKENLAKKSFVVSEPFAKWSGVVMRCLFFLNFDSKPKIKKMKCKGSSFELT